MVRENLALALPHLTEEERLKNEEKFYRHMCDMFLEMIKTMSISSEEMDKRFKFINLENYLEIEKQGKSIAIMIAHYASYEWSLSIYKHIDLHSYAIYKKINNKYFDRLVHKLRSRFKGGLIDSEAIAVIENHHKEGIKGLYGFASDQSPLVRRTTYWSEFMGIRVPVHTGAEMLSKKFDMNVVFMRVKKVKRGFYEAEFELISDKPKLESSNYITETFLRKVEGQILESPEFYLWTHRRWKHRNNNIYGK